MGTDLLRMVKAAKKHGWAQLSALRDLHTGESHPFCVMSSTSIGLILLLIIGSLTLKQDKRLKVMIW